jgi:nucleotide-binding universal stress UspA family protein
MYDTVVFPTDGERSSERACEDAVELASLHDATLHVVHVVDEATVELLSEVGETGRETVEETLESDAEEMVEEAAEVARVEGVDVEVSVIHGKPDEEIVAYAEENDADLIVMGTEERMDEYRDLLGSATESVLRKTSRRVMVVKTQPDLPPESSLS